MVGESRNVFTKRLLGETHISGIMCENLGGTTPPLLHLAADAHALVVHVIASLDKALTMNISAWSLRTSSNSS